MLLRNIDPEKGLLNGTRLIVNEMHKNLINCDWMQKENKSNNAKN